jgi:hypothetical protein
MPRLSEIDPAPRPPLEEYCPPWLTPEEYLAIQGKHARRPNYQGSYLSAIRALARLAKASPQEIAADLGPELRQRALDPRRGLSHYIQLLQDLKRAIERQRPGLKVVREGQDGRE